MHDEKILTAIKSRDETVIGEVITKYSKLMWSIAEAVLRNGGTAQDIEESVADTFIYLWENPEKYDPRRGKLKTWLAIVARTQAINRYREIAKRSTIALEDTAFVDQMGIVDGILEDDVRRALLAAVNTLGEPEREILIRRYYYGQKPKEIALALDLNIKQVDNHLYRTKLRLRKVLTD